MVIPCLVEYIDNVSDANCLAFLKRMRTVVFSDYRLIYKFVDGCSTDIDQFQCGRLQQETAEVTYIKRSFFVRSLIFHEICSYRWLLH